MSLEEAVEMFNREYNIFRERPMTSEQAYATIKNLRGNNKKKFTDEEKRALEYTMVMIAQKVGEDVLSRKEVLSE